MYLFKYFTYICHIINSKAGGDVVAFKAQMFNNPPNLNRISNDE